MDRREAWLLREAARKRANVMGLQEWAEDIAQETVLRSLDSNPLIGEQLFFESVLFIVETNFIPREFLSVHFH